MYIIWEISRNQHQQPPLFTGVTVVVVTAIVTETVIALVIASIDGAPVPGLGTASHDAGPGTPTAVQPAAVQYTR